MLLRQQTIFVVDDDPVVRRILRSIIEGEHLGQLVGEAEDGRQAQSSILAVRPDIVLVDLLLPAQDGIQTVQRIRQQGYSPAFIMISQVNDKTLVGEAYQAGVEFFINKPINRLEVISVVGRVLEKIRLQEAIDRIRNSVDLITATTKPRPVPAVADTLEPTRTRPAMTQILSDLGILGEAGCADILCAVTFLLEQKPEERAAHLRQLRILYEKVREFSAPSSRPGASMDAKAIEQRIRRAIATALRNVASLGLEDYSHQTFEHYANRFFDFPEVRAEMRFLRQESPYRGKINIRKFLEAALVEVTRSAG